ncbi:MAG: phospholipase D family protein [Pseudomonadota bacterium]
MRGGGLSRAGLLLAGLLTLSAWASPPLEVGLHGSAQVAFTPGDDAAELVVAALAKARRQVLVQAYAFTHEGIAQALVTAKRRGVDVQVIADRDQAATLKTSLVAWLAGQGVPVWLDGEHNAAHNKVMLIDNGSPEAVLVTGSYNFTQAAQHRNAENLLLLRGNPTLTEAYAANFRRHKTHSVPHP